MRSVYTFGRTKHIANKINRDVYNFLFLVQEEFTVKVTYPVYPTLCSSVTWRFKILISNTVYNGAHAPNTSFIHSAFFSQRKAQTKGGTWLLRGYNTVRVAVSLVKVSGELLTGEIHQCQIT
ncbi:hypothetical protein AMECASPLE_007330 [Ameca splendens]|uniref:Speckle-type POZ protein n=1 Tax=Ameca splendens TaxID=208324 RepID=A0ABV0XNS8_9TELE